MADTRKRIEGQEEQTVELRTNADLRHEIEEKTLAEDVLRQLSHRVVQLQDQERRRIARELHDSIGQQLSAIAMNLSMLESRVGSEIRPEVQEILRQINTCTIDVRTISHLLHPPLLDEVGLSAALEGYVTEFSKRSRIHVELELPSKLGRMKSELETAVFRIVQESLTNIHRHSGAQKASISLARNGTKLTIRVSDNGRGISKETLRRIAAGQSGVGVTGMKERVKQFGGTFQVHSSPGTTLQVELPFLERG